ncbi:MAG: hypothetical protein ABI822_24210 [Bryobacteraceae bacterium]
MLKRSLLAVILAGHIIAADAVTDETPRLQALAAAFPGRQISLVPGKTVDATWKPKNLTKNSLGFPDAMAHEKVYQVTAVGDVRLQLYKWPAAGWLAVVQSHSGPLLLHLAQDWKVKERVTLDAHGQSTFQGIRLVDLTGDGRDELVLESDFAEQDAVGSNMHIYDLTQGHFDELLDMASRMSASVMKDEQYLQVLDVPRSVKEKGKQYCFVKTMEGKWFPAPRVSSVCYPRGRGVEPPAK